MSSGLAWSIWQVPGHPGLYNEKPVSTQQGNEQGLGDWMDAWRTQIAKCVQQGPVHHL